jgi:two-component system sensor histidine kinase FlrB
MNSAVVLEKTPSQKNSYSQQWNNDDLTSHFLPHSSTFSALNPLPAKFTQRAKNDSLSDTHLKTLLNALPAGVIVLDGMGLVNECNPAAIALLGEPLLGELWRTVIERSFNPTPSGQDMITNKGRVVSISTCPLGDNLPGQIILLQDVTTNRQLQSQLDQQKRLATMGQMAAQLAHQIRTPIASALLYASHLKRNNLSEENRLRFADKILNRIKNLENLIKDMLLFSKNGMEQAIDLPVQQLLETIKSSTNLNPQTKINFISTLPENTLIHGNQNLLVSALLNLIENAEQSADSATIKLEIISRLKGFVDFKISDNGKGIEKQVASKIFDPFYTNKPQGTGLGLAVVKAICHGHRGELWLEKTSQKGSIFIMRLPLKKNKN